MGIYRGAGGTGDAVADSSSEALLVRQLAIEVQADADAAAASAAAALVSENNAADSESAAATSETNAASSATSAAADAASILSSVADAEAAQAAAEAAQAAAATSATSASTSATNAASSASSASTSASNAASSATGAANSASTATTQATNASNSATAAATSATNAASSASSASTSATNAASSATSASGSATSASSSASSASTSASNAAASETSAAGSATTATTQAGIATSAATSATASASSATSSDSSASTSATNAASSATSAATSATNAATSEANAAATLANALVKTNNLSDLTSVSTARTNLGLGTLATQNANEDGAGVLVAPSITITGSGSTVDVGSTTANVHSIAGWMGTFNTYTIPAATGLALTNNSANYLVVNYNAGSPIYQITTDVTTINGSNILGATLLWRNGTEVHYQPINWGLATASRLNRRAVQTNRYERANGLALGETTGRVITVSSGSIWYGVNEYAETAQTSASSNAEFWYHSAGVWTKSTVSTYNNTQYDNGTNLVNLSGAGTQYAVNWVYRYLDGSGLPKIAYILGSGNYSQAQAIASSPPVPPTILSTMAILVGRIIVAETASTAFQIDSAFTQVFSSTAVTEHNDLANIQGGTTDEYYHLTQTQYNAVAAGFDPAGTAVALAIALG